MMTQFVEVPSRSDFLILLQRDEDYSAPIDEKTEIPLPKTESIAISKPTSEFILPDVYLRANRLIYPPADWYELDDQDLDFLAMHNYIQESELISCIKILEKNEKRRESQKNIKSIPYQIIYYWYEKKKQLGRSLLRMYMKENVFQTRLEPKKKGKQKRIRINNKDEFQNNSEIRLLEYRIGSKLLKMVKEREKIKKAILQANFLVEPNYQKEYIDPDENDAFNELHMLKSKLFGSLSCNQDQDCFFNLFAKLPKTFLSTEVIEYMTYQSQKTRERGISIPWPDQPAIVRDIYQDVLFVKPLNRLGTFLNEDKRIIIGEQSETMILKQLDENLTEILLIKGNTVNISDVEMSFTHIKEHGVQYQQNERNYIQLIQEQIAIRKNIYVEVDEIESCDIYIQI